MAKGFLLRGYLPPNTTDKAERRKMPVATTAQREAVPVPVIAPKPVRCTCKFRWSLEGYQGTVQGARIACPRCGGVTA